jgi:5-methylcytosine-specific restriction endonuclease McrA
VKRNHPSSINRMMCKIHGCDDMARGDANGLAVCGKHRQRWIKSGCFDLPVRYSAPSGVCVIEGCAHEVRSKRASLCDAHYMRKYRGSSSAAELRASSCGRCGIKINKGKFCSAECGWKKARGTPDSTVCVICSSSFKADGPHKTCSKKCQAELKSNHENSYRARKASVESEVFGRNEIFERDGWICQLCGGQIDRSASPRSSMAPALDHVIPIVSGGPNTRANTQCVHMKCNSRKKDRHIPRMGFANEAPPRRAWTAHLIVMLLYRCGNRCEECKCDLNGGGINIDHRPPLALRRVEFGEHVPHQHDPAWLDVLCVRCHSIRTSKGKGAQRSDASNIAKVRRVLTKAQGIEKPKAKIKSAPMKSGKRKIQSRGFQKKPPVSK